MLTSRYNIPIENISYEYIDRLQHCRDTEKELEKIIKILESGELGHYPDLLKRTRDKLREVNPTHKLVRDKPSPVERLDGLDPDLASALKNELNDWCKQIKSKETGVVLAKGADGKTSPPKDASPSSNFIRGTNILPATSSTISISKTRIKSCDYEAWDKFDPDVEIKKMDVAVEREKVRLRKSEMEKKTGGGGDNMAAEEEENYYTQEERMSRANVLRVKGNESYKAGKNQEAIDLYSKSIQLHRTTLALGNRAQVHIKLRQFDKAIKDCDEALSIDPHFIKANYRKAVALYRMERYEEASEWFERVLREEPENKTVHEFMTKLHSIVPVKLRLNGSQYKGPMSEEAPKIVPLEGDKEKSTKFPNLTEKTQKPTDNLGGRKITNRSEQRNEWGLKKQVCVCAGKPGFMEQYEQHTRNINNTKSSQSKRLNNTNKGISSRTKPKQKISSSRLQKSSTEIKRKYNEFLNPTEDFKPKSIIDIFSTEQTSALKGPNHLVSEQLELVPKSKKEKGTQKPKIEILDSVDFEE